MGCQLLSLRQVVLHCLSVQSLHQLCTLKTYCSHGLQVLQSKLCSSALLLALMLQQGSNICHLQGSNMLKQTDRILL